MQKQDQEVPKSNNNIIIGRSSQLSQEQRQHQWPQVSSNISNTFYGTTTVFQYGNGDQQNQYPGQDGVPFPILLLTSASPQTSPAPNGISPNINSRLMRPPSPHPPTVFPPRQPQNGKTTPLNQAHHQSQPDSSRQSL